MSNSNYAKPWLLLVQPLDDVIDCNIARSTSKDFRFLELGRLDYKLYNCCCLTGSRRTMNHRDILTCETSRNRLLLTCIKGIIYPLQLILMQMFNLLIHNPWRDFLEENFNETSVPPSLKVKLELLDSHLASLVSDFVG